jgi:hypothetical protein
MKMVDLARKLNEGKQQGGTGSFYAAVIERTVYVHGSNERVWDERSKDSIGDMPAGPHEKLMQACMRINGLKANAVEEEKNGSAPGGSSSTSSQSE